MRIFYCLSIPHNIFHSNITPCPSTTTWIPMIRNIIWIDGFCTSTAHINGDINMMINNAVYYTAIAPRWWLLPHSPCAIKKPLVGPMCPLNALAIITCLRLCCGYDPRLALNFILRNPLRHCWAYFHYEFHSFGYSVSLYEFDTIVCETVLSLY